MSQSGFTPISIYYSTTASAVPTAANLVQGELAINTADGKLYYEDSSGVVQVLATKSTGSIGGSNTQVQFNNSGSLGGSSGLTWDGSFLTTSSIKNSALTSGRVTYAGTTGLLQDSANLTFNGTTLTANTIGAYTLGGTIAGGGNQLNNIIIGTSTPLAGSFTTLSASSESIATQLTLGGVVATGVATGMALRTGSTKTAWLLGAQFNANNAFEITPSTTAGGTTFTSPAFLVTSTGNVGIGTTSPSANLDIVVGTGSAKIKVGDGTVSGGAYINLQGASGAKTWFVASNYNVGGALEFTQSTANGGSTIAGTASMLLDSSGNLGLGVTPSASNLPTMQSTYALISGNSQVNILQNAYYNSGFLFTGSGYATQYQQLSGEHRWKVSTASGTAGNAISFTQAMTLNADGQLLLGTTSAFNSAYTMSLKVSGSTGGLIIQPGADSYTAIQFNNAAGSGVGSISVSSTLTSYNVTSDQRLKTNIVDAPSGNIDGIKVRSFDWIADGSYQEYGMVAQELIEVAPYAVNKPENPDEMMGVDYSKLVPMMIKEIQDLKAEVNQLKAKIGV